MPSGRNSVAVLRMKWRLVIELDVGGFEALARSQHHDSARSRSPVPARSPASDAARASPEPLGDGSVTWLPSSVAILPDEMLGQRGNVLPALPQRRHVDGDYVEPVVEVLAKLPAFQSRPEIRVGGRNDADVDLARLVAAQAFELPLLEHAQELHLDRPAAHRRFHREKTVPVSACSNLPGLEAAAPVKAPFLVAEQLALHEILREWRCS